MNIVIKKFTWHAYVASGTRGGRTLTRDLGSRPGRVVVLIYSARHLTLSTQEFKPVPANCQGNQTKRWAVKNDGTAFRGRSDILSRFILHAPNRLDVKLVIACAPMWTTQFNFWFKKIKLLCFYSITCLTFRYFITQVFHNFDLMVTRLCVAIFCLHSYSCCLIFSIIQTITEQIGLKSILLQLLINNSINIIRFEKHHH